MNKQRGFTLVEVLLASALVGILFAGLSGLLVAVRQPALAWEEKAEGQRRAAALLERIGRDLSFAMEEAGNKPLLFQGSREKMEFYITPDVAVSYFFLAAEGKLERIQNHRAKKETASQFLKAGKRFLDFKLRFLGEEGWVSEWKSEKWPRAVEVKGALLQSSGKEVSFEKQFYPIR